MASIDKSRMRYSRRRNRSKRPIYKDRSKPRLVIFRSNKHIYGQVIDDLQGVTLATCSTIDKEVREQVADLDGKIEKSQVIGKELAVRATAKGVKEIVFDRNGFTYHGRVKAFAAGAREGGLKF